LIVGFVLVATLIAGAAAPVAGFAILVLGLLGALIVDFNGWKQADDAGDYGPSPLGLMEPLARARPQLADDAGRPAVGHSGGELARDGHSEA
jgi:hypothetical protein